MIFALNTSVILLTYKGKVLLTVKDYSSDYNVKNVWSMIESNKMIHESFLDAIIRKAKEEMNIQLKNVSFLFKTKHDDGIVYFCHGKLTDDNVNSIERKERQQIQFFSQTELVNLQLAPITDSFLAEYQNELRELLVNKIF